MFTGLIETMGVITGARPRGRSVELCVKPDMPDFGTAIGGSVAIDGVCLTLEKSGADGQMFFTAVSETLKRTAFDRVIPGRRVNLERAMRADGRFDGHIVLGHVDAAGRIVGDEDAGTGIVRTIEIPDELLPLMAEKGSVAVDGISLTIASVDVNRISISLIPATISKTTMSTKKSGDAVNIECDVMARYIYRMIKTGVFKKENLADKMERLGF
jgi:riboflavin synthase